MKRLFVVTHPEATHHVDGLVGGWFDSALTERGLRDAGRIAETLRSDFGLGSADSADAGSSPSDRGGADGSGGTGGASGTIAEAGLRIVSSDLLRTRQTAEVIADALGVPVELDAGLREKSYGAAERRLQSWLDERFITPPAVGERMDHDEGIEGAETKLEWFTRVYASMDRLVNGTADDTDDAAGQATPGGVDDLVIVTHGGTATPVIASWMRIPLSACAYAAFRVRSGSISLLTEDDRFHNRSLTVLGHLPDSQRRRR